MLYRRSLARCLFLRAPGSGKNTSGDCPNRNLIRHHIRPDRILAVTFTNKAAQEMRERVSGQLGLKRRNARESVDAPQPIVGTFHSNCVKILRRHARKLGYPEKFAIYDSSDQESVARDVLRQLRVHSGMLSPGDFLSYVSRWKNAGARPTDAAELARSDAEHLAASGYRRYQQAVKLAGAMDFDDLLLVTVDLLEQFTDVRREERTLRPHLGR